MSQTVYKEGYLKLVLTRCKDCDLEFSGRGLRCFDCSIWRKINTFLRKHCIPCKNCGKPIEKSEITNKKRGRKSILCDDCFCG